MGSEGESEAFRRARASIPRPHSTGHRSARTYGEQDAQAVFDVVPAKSVKSALWLAEVLNEAITDYLASFAINHPSVPSEQARWNAELRQRADSCLSMIAPGFSENYPPRRPVPEVYATLFRNGTPEGIKAAHLHWLGYNDAHDALDRVTDALWLLRSFAANAEERWRERVAGADRRGRKSVRRWLLTWVSDLGRYYAHAFRELPSYTVDGPFVRFADAIRRRAIQVRDEITDSGLDSAAYVELAHFDSGKLASFAKKHIKKLRPRWQMGLDGEIEPDRFKLGIAGEKPHTE